ncbi:MAG: hypothetical protein OXK80_02105 [Bdellovibrionales bacterium]|nr:hypothetical protein [Bdellovibrionales bacterium]
MNMKTVGLIIVLFGLTSCVDSTSLDYLASISDSGGRSSDSRIGRRRSTRSTNQCEDSERCENICDQMLDASDERKSCYRLSLKEIGKVEEVFDELKTVHDLSDIRQGDFDLFASVALSSWSNVIRGEYRRDEEDDDDEDGDDPGGPAYTPSQAEDVLSWIILNKSVAESIRDFSDKRTHIIADLLVHSAGQRDVDDKPIKSTPYCSDTVSDTTNDTEICSEIESSSSLTEGEKIVLQNIQGYLGGIVTFSSDDEEVSAIYELTHDVLSRVCENVDSINGYGSDRSYKACLSWIYFCPSVYDNEGTGAFRYSANQIDQYLLKDTYLSVPEVALRNCTFLTHEPEWSDYWD